MKLSPLYDYVENHLKFLLWKLLQDCIKVLQRKFQGSKRVGGERVCKSSWNWFYDISNLPSSDEDCQTYQEKIESKDNVQYLGTYVEPSKVSFAVIGV
ncbi:hypothetical protein P3S68_031438 [Capsicum galapagoense]